MVEVKKLLATLERHQNANNCFILDAIPPNTIRLLAKRKDVELAQ